MVAAVGLILGVAAVQNWLACALLACIVVALMHLRSGLICAAAFALGCLISPAPSQSLAEQQWVDLDATVASVPLTYPTESVSEISSGSDRLMMSAPADSRLVLGERIRVRGLARPLGEGSLPLANRGIVGRITPVSIQVLAKAPWICQIGEAWRDSFAAFCQKWLPPQAAAETEAVCFNISSALDPGSRQALTRSGTVHIVSASGLHVGLIALVLFGLLSLFPIPRIGQLTILASVLALYAVASGLHPPVVRASIMAIILASAFLVWREPDMFSALALAAIVQLLWTPRALFDPGFQISFVVVGAFALFAFHSSRSKRSDREQIAERGKNIVKGTALATLASAPLAAYSFGTVSFTSIFANLGIVFVLPFLVVTAMAAHLLSFILAPLAVGLMVGLVGPLAGWLGFATDHLGGEWAAISVPAFSGYWLLLIYGLLLFLWRPRLRPA